VKMGLPWPKEAVVAQNKPKWQEHWAFKPIAKPATPTSVDALVAASESNLKHEYGWVRHSLVAISGPILDVMKQDKEIPLGSSGIQIQIKVDQIIEGIRPGRIVRIRPMNWPDEAVPREEYTEGHLEERFPSPDIFPKYGKNALN